MAIGGKQFAMDHEYMLPALTVDIIVSSPNPLNENAFKLRALIDTGSDFVIIPNHIIERLELDWTGVEKDIEGWTGTHSPMRFFVAKIIIEDVVDDVFIIGNTDSEEALVGLDLLNRLHMLINGPNETFEIANKNNYIQP